MFISKLLVLELGILIEGGSKWELLSSSNKRLGSGAIRFKFFSDIIFYLFNCCKFFSTLFTILT